MPINFRALAGGEASTTVTFNGHKVALRFDPSRVTENVIRDVIHDLRERRRAETPTADGDALMAQALTQLNDALVTPDTINAMLCRFLIWWDVLDDDEVTMFPITEERLGDLLLPFRQAVLNAILDDMRLGETNGTPSKTRSQKRS